MHRCGGQRALGEAEMVVDQKMDVGDVGRKSRLVRSAPLDISGRAAETPLASYIELRPDG